MSDAVLNVLFCILGLMVGAFLTLKPGGTEDTAYARGVADCKAGRENYVITVTPEGVDTAYVHP